jgi:heme/copper-type cytochrome/quinol oxidase subunit 2
LSGSAARLKARPGILAQDGVAWWFRSSNVRARYLPTFEYSGRLEILVWSVPAMTVLLVGGVHACKMGNMILVLG